MTTTLELPDDLLREVRRRAEFDGQEFSVSVTQLLRKALASPPPEVGLPRPVMKIHPKTGLPYFDSPMDAPARSMTIEELLALEQQTLFEEDLARLGLSIRQ